MGNPIATAHPRPPDMELDVMARRVASMRYDAVQVFLARLAEALRDDACDDWDRGRTQVASRLDRTASHVLEASQGASALWRICEPHIRGGHDPCKGGPGCTGGCW